jgi:predicted GNAT superfamily acetyltransferase/predicted GIY-YIG superfamily endonuclease
MWEYHILDQISEFEQVVDLEIRVWETDAREAVPTSLLHAMANSGSIVVGAYDENRLIGMALAFPGRRDKKWLLWSHMAGVHPTYQGKGVGFGLKQFQRDWALSQGYKTIAWTFDPLQSGNANFNFRRLGVVSDIYHVDFYGHMPDGINAGLPSDRLEVTWNLSAPRVKALAATQKPAEHKYSIENQLLKVGINKEPVLDLSLIDAQQAAYLIEIPANISSLKQANPELAYEWRIALRNALQMMLSKSFMIVDFLEIAGRFYYLGMPPKPWFLYVLECNDHSFYTGITPDLEQRLYVHNAGRGASYTRSRLPVKMVAAWQFSNHSAALQAEYTFKKLPRGSKLALIDERAKYREASFVL